MCVRLNAAATELKVAWVTGEQSIEQLHHGEPSLSKKATIHQVTTMLATSKNVLFPGHNHLLTTGTDVSSLAGARVIIEVLSHQYWWLAGGYDLEIGYC